jgi:hypothetical protein
MYHFDYMEVVLEVNVVLVWWRLLKFMQMSRGIGVLMIIIIRMVSDVALWGIVSMVVTISFTVSFIAASSEPHAVPAAILWATLGTYDVAEVDKWNPTTGQPLLWFFVVVSNIVLVNLLIAMMGDTFGTIKENADEEWKTARLRSVLQAVERFPAIPPPFNLPFTLYKFITQLGMPSKKSAAQRAKDRQDWSVEGKKWSARQQQARVFAEINLKRKQKHAEDREADPAEQVNQMQERIKSIEAMQLELKALLFKAGKAEGGGQSKTETPTSSPSKSRGGPPSHRN